MWFRQENAAQEGYFEGTNYDANSFFYERRKKSERHSLNLTALYTPILELKTPNTAEVTN
jgi:hypothetical protein